jgi:hypothetical protein
MERVDATVIDGTFPGGVFGKVVTMTLEYPGRSPAQTKVVALKYFVNPEIRKIEKQNIDLIMSNIKALGDPDLVERFARYTCLPFEDGRRLSPSEQASAEPAVEEALKQAIIKNQEFYARVGLIDFRAQRLLKPIRMTTFHESVDLERITPDDITKFDATPNRVLSDVIYALYTVTDCLLMGARPLAHEDLKPANLLMGGRPGAYEGVKVIDFGIMNPAKVDRWNVGTPAFYSFSGEYKLRCAEKYKSAVPRFRNVDSSRILNPVYAFVEKKRRRLFTAFSTLWWLVKADHISHEPDETGNDRKRTTPPFLEYLSRDPLLDLFVRMVLDAMEALCFAEPTAVTDSMQFLYDHVLRKAGELPRRIADGEARLANLRAEIENERSVRAVNRNFITDLVEKCFPTKALKAYHEKLRNLSDAEGGVAAKLDVQRQQRQTFDGAEFENWLRSRGDDESRGGGTDDASPFLVGWAELMAALKFGAERGPVPASAMLDSPAFGGFYETATRLYPATDALGAGKVRARWRHGGGGSSAIGVCLALLTSAIVALAGL